MLSIQRCTSARLWHHGRITCFQQFRHSSIFLNGFLYNSYHNLHQSCLALKLNHTCVTPLMHQHTLLDPSKAQEDGFLETIAWQKCSRTVHPSHPTHRSCPSPEGRGSPRHLGTPGVISGVVAPCSEQADTACPQTLCQTNSVLVTSTIPMGCHGPSPSCQQSSNS